MPGGILEVAVDRIHLETAVVQRGYYGMGVLAAGAWPADHVCLGLVLETPSHATVNGFLCPSMSVQLYAEGVEVSYRAPPGSTWFAYCVKREVLQQTIETLFGQTLNIPRSGTISINLTPPDRRRLAISIAALFSAVSSSNLETQPRQITALECQLLYDFARAVVPTGKRKRPASERHASNRRRLMSLAEDYLRANLAKPFVLGDCATAIGCSERMLERHFLAIYGVPPSIWFRCMKLNAVRTELAFSGNKGTRISDVATAWGFSHFGRFSVEYHKLFGEAPSTTLKSAR